MSDNNQAIYGEPQVVELVAGDIGIGSYIVNDYLLTVTPDTNGNGYLFTIRKGRQEQTIHLTELTQEAVNSSIDTALSQAKESGEFDGNGIESVVFNPDYTLSLYFTDGTSVTTGSIKGAKGDTGVGIASTELNSNYTLTIDYTDGTSYTTPSIRGEKGDKGDKGDPCDSIEFHICSSSEYNHVTMTPTVANPKSTAFYLVPSTSAVNTDLFIEWIYVNGAWEKFGSATINLDSYATKTEVSTKMDKATNTGSAGQVLTSNGSGGQTWSNAAIPDWNAVSGSAGFIRNKPDFKAGTGADSITNRHSLVSGSHSMATGTNNTVSGADSYATGSGNNVKSTGTLMAGSYNTAELRGSNSLVGGSGNSVSNGNAIAAGSNNTVTGVNATVNGSGNTVSGANAFSSGFGNTASGNSSHAEGIWVTASADASHAEGIESIASNSASHAEGQNTTASGLRAHAEGSQSTASGDQSHAEGVYTTASGHCSHAEGFGTTANHQAQHAFGSYNIPDANTANADNKGTYIEIVGNGAYQTPSNARTLDWNGNEWIKGNFKMGGNSYDDPNAKELATKEYVDQAIQNLLASLGQ